MRLGFACPYYGGTPPPVVVSQLSAIMHVAWQHPWVATCTTNRSPHVPACEQILKRALSDPNIDALFWTEHDCILPTDSVTRLVKILEEHPEVDVATGITFMRYKPYHPMIANHAGILTKEIYESKRRFISIMPSESGDPGIGKDHYSFLTHIDTTAEPYLVDATSLNCVLFRRRALEIAASFPSPFATDRCTTPDFALFDRLRGHIKLMVDPALLTLHLGEQEAIGVDMWVNEMERLIAEGAAERLDTPGEGRAEA